jgi:diadenosine tetraphosphatase ApaH/serine/threonine PP2A family protein phosphatase
MSATRVLTNRLIHSRHAAVAAGGICLLSSVIIGVQPTSADDQDSQKLQRTMPDATTSSSSYNRPKFPIHATSEDYKRIQLLGAVNDGDASCASLQQQESLVALDRLDLMNLKKEEALEVISHIHNGGRIDMNSMMEMCQATTRILKQEPTLLDKAGTETVTVVGDLHGSLPSLKKILKIIGDLDDKSNRSRCIVFDGDFVDRGDDSVEVLLTLLLLKIAYPEQVVLLRGNHEDNMVAQVYGFADELLTKYSLGNDKDEGQAALKPLWSAISEIFAALPMGVVTDTAFIVHGGLPSNDFRLDQLRQVTVEDRCNCRTMVRHQTSEIERMLGGLLWSDPSRRCGIHPNDARGYGVTFGPDVAQTFLTRENLKYLVRGHEEVKSGYKAMFCGDDKSVITVFSAVDYESRQNRGAVVNLTSDGNHSAVTFDLQQEDKDLVEDYLNDSPKSSSWSLLDRLESVSQHLAAFRSTIDDKQQQ